MTLATGRTPAVSAPATSSKWPSSARRLTRGSTASWPRNGARTKEEATTLPTTISRTNFQGTPRMMLGVAPLFLINAAVPIHSIGLFSFLRAFTLRFLLDANRRILHSIPKRSCAALRTAIFLVAPSPSFVFFGGELKMPFAVRALLEFFLAENLLSEH